MNTFSIQKTSYFDVKQTLDSGQVFRYHKIDGGYKVFSLDKTCDIFENENEFIFKSLDIDYFYNYFDLDTDYCKLQEMSLELENNLQKFGDISCNNMLKTAVEFGKGIHILKQDPIEMIFSFIISQNNHIPRIKSILERICNALGECKDGYYAFPTIEKLASCNKEFYKSMGAGYRDSFLESTAKSLTNISISEIEKLDTTALRNLLMSFRGVGRKVADCILLFGFSRLDVFPVDTWIAKVFSEFAINNSDKLSIELVKRYEHLSGYIQQWLFYAKREGVL